MWSDDIESWQQIWSDVVSVLLSKTPDPLLQPLKTPIHNFCTLTVTIFTYLLYSESETNHWWRNFISILWMLELKKLKICCCFQDLTNIIFWHRFLDELASFKSILFTESLSHWLFRITNVLLICTFQIFYKSISIDWW